MDNNNHFDTNGNGWIGALGGFLVGNLINGNGGGGILGGGGNNNQTALLQADISNLTTQLQGINDDVQRGQEAIASQISSNNLQNAFHENALAQMQGVFGIQSAIAGLGTQMQLGFKDVQLQSALQTCDVKDTVNAGFTRQLENELATLRSRQHFHDFFTPLYQQVSNINVTAGGTPTTKTPDAP